MRPDANAPGARSAERFVAEELVVALGAVGIGKRVAEALEERSFVEDGHAAEARDRARGLA